jgi:hypothetical protein
LGSLPSLSPAPAAVGWVAPFGRFGFLGVCRGCSFSLFRLRPGRWCRSPLGPLSGRPLGRFRPRSVVPRLAPVAVGVRGGGPVRFFRRRFALRAVVGSAVAGPARFLRRSPGGRWLRGVGAGLPVRAAVPLGVARPGGRPCRLERRSRRCRCRCSWPAGRVAAGAGSRTAGRAASRCAARLAPSRRSSVGVRAASGCRRWRPVGAACSCCCRSLALAGLRRCPCGWPARSCGPLRRRCPACRSPSRRAGGAPALHLVALCLLFRSGKCGCF